MDFNVMVYPIPLYSELPHFVKKGKSYDFKRRISRFTRTERPVKYYYIDFGLSYKFSSEKDNLVRVAFGGDKSVPEYKDAKTPKDPYKIDVYCLGNLIKKDMIEVSSRYIATHCRALTVTYHPSASVWLGLLEASGHRHD